MTPRPRGGWSRAALLGLATAFAGAAWAGEPRAETCWRVAPGSLEIAWQARWGETVITGGFRDARVAIMFDEDAPEAARIEAEIAIDSLHASDPEAVDLLRDSAWFDPQRHPLARYEAKGLAAVGTEGGTRRYRAEGLLTLKGRTAPVPLLIRLTPADDGLAAEAQGVIDRTVFGIGAGPIAAQTAREVSLHIRLRARPSACGQADDMSAFHH